MRKGPSVYTGLKGFLGRLWARRGFREYVVLLILVLSASFTIVYANVQTFDPALSPELGYSDSIDYIAMYHGEPGSGIRGYRPLVPWLARLVPTIPASFFVPDRKITSEYQVAIKFGLINFIFLVGTCLVLYALLRDFGLSFFIALIGVFLFLTSQTIVRGAGLPMTDVAFFFFFTMAILAMKRQQFWLLLFACTVGVAVKELMLLCIPLVLLMPIPWKERLKLLAAIVPAIAVYVIIRLYMPNTLPSDGYLIARLITYLDDQIRLLLRPNGWINLFWSFGFAWIPAIYSLFAAPLPKLLKRWAWLLPIVAVGVFLGAGNLSRSIFTAAPIVVCLAAFGISRMLKGAKPALDSAPGT